MNRASIKKRSKYPAYPGSNWDYAIHHSASFQLISPNKAICIYCRQQAITTNEIKHELDCPARHEKEEQ